LVRMGGEKSGLRPTRLNTIGADIGARSPLWAAQLTFRR
jgi:hypothetical protein